MDAHAYFGSSDALATLDRNDVSVSITSQHGSITTAVRPKAGFPDVTTLHAIVEESTPDFLFVFALALLSGPARGREIHLILENDDNVAHLLDPGGATVATRPRSPVTTARTPVRRTTVLSRGTARATTPSPSRGRASTAAGATPLYGMCTIFIPVIDFSSSFARCVVEPAPGEGNPRARAAVGSARNPSGRSAP